MAPAEQPIGSNPTGCGQYHGLGSQLSAGRFSQRTRDRTGRLRSGGHLPQRTGQRIQHPDLAYAPELGCGPRDRQSRPYAVGPCPRDADENPCRQVGLVPRPMDVPALERTVYGRRPTPLHQRWDGICDLSDAHRDLSRTNAHHTAQR